MFFFVFFSAAFSGQRKQRGVRCGCILLCGFRGVIGSFRERFVFVIFHRQRGSDTVTGLGLIMCGKDDCVFRPFFVERDGYQTVP